ncbi:MAG: hypothetical protein AB7F20_01030 [Geoalkalibacter sp.]|jgi:hypothetical protein|uniref:hypothetical protein n=1 Tax=Geoalkalibacter sp. TaxID=3041440 RepID=UPI003D12F3C7
MKRQAEGLPSEPPDTIKKARPMPGFFNGVRLRKLGVERAKWRALDASFCHQNACSKVS